MTLDAYQPCPGGLPKKIKFCQCAKDILGDLSKIMTSLGGGQKAAAMGRINQLLASHGPRACLLAMKGSVNLETGNLEELAKTTEVFNQQFPENPIALAFSAILAASEGELDAAVERVQQSLEASQGTIHEATYAAIGIAGRLLAQAGCYVAAIGHLTLQAAIAPEEDKDAWELLRSLHSSPAIPALLKYHPVIPPPPPGATWANALKQAEEPVERGCWREAVARLTALDGQFPGQPAILQRLARYQGWLNREEDAAESLHRLAAAMTEDLDQAAEIEATAQLLAAAENDTVDEIAQTYPVNELDQMMERLLSEKQVIRMPVEPSQLGKDGSPPPKGAFWLLDRVVPASGKELQLHDIPNVLGEMYVYGRETDRQARLEFVTVKSSDFAQKLQVLEKLLDEYCGTPEREESLGQVPAEVAAMSWQWRLPDDTPREKREELMEQKRRDMNLNVWPEIPLAALDGKRPVDVAGDPAYRVRLLGAILLLELAGERSRAAFDFDELRARLGLPTREEFDPGDADVTRLAPTRLHLLRAENLSDEQLLDAFEYAVTFHMPRAAVRLGQQLLGRPGLLRPEDRPRIFGLLATFAENVTQSFELLHQAREQAEAIGQSPAPWLFRELEMRMMTGDSRRATELFRVLQTRHINEPGVSQALYSLLVRIGAVTPDGKPAAAAMQEQPGQAPGVVTGQPEPAAAPEGLWTPDAPKRPEAGGEKPKLWVPGMD